MSRSEKQNNKEYNNLLKIKRRDENGLMPSVKQTTPTNQLSMVVSFQAFCLRYVYVAANLTLVTIFRLPLSYCRGIRYLLNATPCMNRGRGPGFPVAVS